MESKRVVEIDIMRCLALVFMVFVHTFEIGLDSFSNYHSGSGYVIVSIIEFFGGAPTAGVFMFVLGWSVVFSKNSSRDYVKKAVIVYILGLVVNFFQQWIPKIVNPEYFGSLSEEYYFISIIAVDIYSFVTLALLMFAVVMLFKDTKKRAIFCGILLITCLIANTVIASESFSTGSDTLDTVLDLFVRVNEWGYFPFITWASYPLAGYLYGLFHKKVSNKELFRLVSFIGGLVLIASIIYGSKVFGLIDGAVSSLHVPEKYYYSMNSLSVIQAISTAIVEFSIFSYLGFLFKREKVVTFITRMSRSTMIMYVMQWILLGLLSNYIVSLEDVWYVVPIGSVVTIVSTAVAVICDKHGIGYSSIKKVKVS